MYHFYPQKGAQIGYDDPVELRKKQVSSLLLETNSKSFSAGKQRGGVQSNLQGN